MDAGSLQSVDAEEANELLRKPETPRRSLKVAVVHDWLVVRGGAEHVLAEILDMFPDADVYCVVFSLAPDEQGLLGGRSPKTTFIQRLPRASTKYRRYFPLMPLAIEQFDFSAYDLVISSSYCVAKGVITGPNQVHVSYVHSSPRWAWDSAVRVFEGGRPRARLK